MAKIEILKCHCGSVELKLTLPNGFENLRKCNSSICSRGNAVVASVSINNLKVVKGGTELREYTFNTHTAKHYFCSICGIYTHHQRRSGSNRVDLLPLNNKIQKLKLDELSSRSPEERTNFEGTWNFYNKIRTAMMLFMYPLFLFILTLRKYLNVEEIR